ncbi:MAG: bacterioferritin-associated ferredoxin [Bradymonadia bacterium]
MIICVCEGVSDRKVREAAQRGISDLEGLKQDCRAGGDCGRCRAALRKMLRNHRSTEAEREA